MEKGSRKTTEQVILTAVHKIINNDGFEKLGINAVATKAGVSKMLIYRYFESMEGLIAAYINQYDIWINFDIPLPDREHLGDFIKSMFHYQILSIRNNSTLRKLYRWEMTTDNQFIKMLREKREQRGFELVQAVSRIAQLDEKQIAPLASILSSAISYLAILSENCPVYNNIPIQTLEGWQQLENGIYTTIDLWINQTLNSK